MRSPRILAAAALALRFVPLPLAAQIYPARDVAAPIAHPHYATKVRIPGTSDAGKLNNYLYRGTQPSKKGLKNLRQLGVDTIVDLRGEFPWVMRRERHEAGKFGMRLVSIPGNGWSPPKDEQVAQFFALFEEQPRHKIFVHCWLGGDRAGVFLAAYRIAFDGWTPDEAIAEMYRFKFHGFWHPAMRRYIHSFPERLKHSRVLARYRHAEWAKAGTEAERVPIKLGSTS